MLVNKENLDLMKVKLVIWDLDNTFWLGTISEDEIIIVEQNIKLVKDLTKRGIVNSICSKNDYDVCKEKLTKMGIWDYFVFPSINWQPKSQRLFQIISEMNLRPDNTLFLDDEPSNLHRALSVNEKIMCGTAQELIDSINSQLEKLKLDVNNNRLRQYQELQTKVEAKKEYDSDEEFLYIAEIKVSIANDCCSQLPRILELINRTNQLNYTKERCEMNELEKLLKDTRFQCGYVSCSDKFCDYGIVGFYALNIEQHCLKHYLYSCRTIGMGIEQFVYAQLGFPKLNVIGEVVTELNTTDKPEWIELTVPKKEKSNSLKRDDKKILIKGPCDVSQIIPFFSNLDVFDSEFAYVSETKKGMYIESFNHTSQIVLSNELTAIEKKELEDTVPFIDGEYFKTNIFQKNYDYVIFSMLTDYGLGLYENIDNPKYVVAFGQYTVDYTKDCNWDNAMKLLMNNTALDEKMEEECYYFKNNYRFIGRISDDYMIENLRYIRKHLPPYTKMIFLNGAETPYQKDCKSNWVNRELLHKEKNKLLESFVDENLENCYIVDVNKYINSPELYLDTINHYKKVVYYKLSGEIQRIINSDDNSIKLLRKSITVSYWEKMLGLLKRIIKRNQY